MNIWMSDNDHGFVGQYCVYLIAVKLEFMILCPHLDVLRLKFKIFVLDS